MKRMTWNIFLGLMLTVHAAWSDGLRVGVDANYSLDMEQAGTVWSWNGESSDLFAGMADQGVREFRVRLWMKDDGPHGKTYATEVVKRALAGGLNPYLVLFLSEDWSDMMKQPLPESLQGLSIEERAATAKTYARDIVTHFRAIGLTNHLYEIGNEIDYGICGEYPNKGAKKTPAALSRRLWPNSALIIRAAQEGVREADPEAMFMLHIAHWWDADFCVAFFQFMLDHGVQLDFAGLSYFPSSNIGGSLEMELFGATASKVAQATGRPIIVPETAYPSTSDFKGQFSRWKYEVPGYPLTPDGQRRWLADFLAFCDRHPHIAAFYYWSPEWCGEGMWKAFALFDPDGKARPAWSSFAPASWTGRTPKQNVYFEACSNRLFSVPVGEAKQHMIPLVLKLREQTGGMNVEHIALLSNTVLHVDGYRVDLKGALSQNLNLTRLGNNPGSPLEPADLESISADLHPDTQQLVLFLRDTPTPELEQAIAFFEQKGIAVILHPKSPDKPLKFGLCGAFGAAQE